MAIVLHHLLALGQIRQFDLGLLAALLLAGGREQRQGRRAAGPSPPRAPRGGRAPGRERHRPAPAPPASPPWCRSAARAAADRGSRCRAPPAGGRSPRRAGPWPGGSPGGPPGRHRGAAPACALFRLRSRRRRCRRARAASSASVPGPSSVQSQSAVVDVERQHLDAVLARVAHDLRRGVEAHRLAVQQRAGEDGRVVALEPGRDIDQQREAGGVALREAVGAEALDLAEAALGEVALVAARRPCPR